MRMKDILKIVVYLPFLVYAFFSASGTFLKSVNPFYLIALPVAGVAVLLFTSRLWFYLLALALANLAIQLSGGAASQLFFFYFLLLFVEGLRASLWRYIVAGVSILVLESLSALFHLAQSAFPLGALLAFSGFVVLAYLFLSVEKRRAKSLEKSLERERAKYHWLDPLSSPREERLQSLKEEKYSIDADVLCSGFVKLVFETLRVHTAGLFLLNKDKLELVAIESQFPRIKKDASITLGEGVIGYLAREGKPTILNDLREDSKRIGYYDAEVDIKALATAPVANAGTNYGIIVVDAERALNEYDKDFLVAVGDLLARDIEISRQYEERHREALRFSGLYEMAGNLLTGLSEEELIERSFELAGDIFDPDATGFARLRDKEGAALLRYDGEKEFDRGFRFEPERSLVAMTAKHKGFLLHRDMSKPGLYRFGPGEKVPANRTFMGIGFDEDEHTRGVLWIEKLEADAYSERDGKILGFAATLLSAAFLRVRYQEQLGRLARLDGLTGLLNHRAFQEELESSIQKRPTVGLFIIDIDHFKNINDTYGHPVGDAVLKKISEVIRDKGIPARYGGEEFAVVITDITSKDMIGKGEELLVSIRRAMIRAKEGTIQVTASVGGAFYPRDAKSREELIKKADAALYRAKTSGRDKLMLSGEG